MIRRFTAAQFECDLLGAAVMCWLQHNPSIEWGDVRHVILDMPWSSPTTIRPLAVFVETGDADELRVTSESELQERMSPAARVIEVYARPAMEAGEKAARL